VTKTGLWIDFYFADGTKDYVSMSYYSFSNDVMELDDMVKWGFTDYDGHYMGEALIVLCHHTISISSVNHVFEPCTYHIGSAKKG